MPSASDLLNLPAHVGQRSATFRFALVDGDSGARRGDLAPLRGSTPTLQHDGTATISRKVSGLTLAAGDAARIDPLVHRVELSMVLGDRVRTEFPLGRYMFADDVRVQHTSGVVAPVTLFDEMFVVDQEMEVGFNAGGAVVDEAARRLLDGLPIADPIVEATDQVTANSWPAGRSRAAVLGELATLGGYFAPWFGHDGRLRLMRVFEPAARPPDFDLDDGNRVVRESISRTSDLPNAPNRFVVISNDDVPVPAVGRYDVPATAPHSIARRGFVVPKVQDMQVASASQAAVVARTLGIQSTMYEQVELVTPPDPRHDAFQVVRFDRELWLEIGWSMTLVEGGAMKHTLRRAYEDTGESA